MENPSGPPPHQNPRPDSSAKQSSLRAQEEEAQEEELSERKLSGMEGVQRGETEKRTHKIWSGHGDL